MTICQRSRCCKCSLCNNCNTSQLLSGGELGEASPLCTSSTQKPKIGGNPQISQMTETKEFGVSASRMHPEQKCNWRRLSALLLKSAKFRCLSLHRSQISQDL